MNVFEKFPIEQRSELGAIFQQLHLPGLEPSMHEDSPFPPGETVAHSELELAIEEINKRFAVCLVGNKIAVMYQQTSPIDGQPEMRFLSPATFKHLYCDRLVHDGNRRIELGKAWLKHPNRRRYTDVVFAPNGAPDDYFNFWQGFCVQPKEGKNHLSYLNHIRENIAGGDKDLLRYIIRFMADAVQNPATKPGVSLVLRGEQGVGKGVFVKHFGSLFGRHYAHVSSLRHLVGHFNSVLKDKLLIYADEAVWVGNKPAEGILKALITEDTVHIEPKGVDAFEVRNYMRLIVASNNDRVVPAGPSERRFCVIDVKPTRKQDHVYFSRIEEDMNNGGRETLMHFLLNFSLKGANLRVFPQTPALEEQKIRSLDEIEQIWFNVLVRGYIESNIDWETPISADSLQRAFAKHIGRAASKSLQTMLGMKLPKLVPGLQRRSGIAVWRGSSLPI